MGGMPNDKKTCGQDRGDFRRGVRHRPGIGRAAWREDGARIFIADRAKADKTLQLIAEAGGKATAVECDVSNPASVAALKEEVEQGGGRCDILVNNAGIYPMQTFDEITFDDWRRVLSVNLDSMFLMTKALAGGMRQSGWGRIVNIASDTVSLLVPELRPLHHQQSRRHRLYPLARYRVRRARRHRQRDRAGADPHAGDRGRRKSPAE